MTFPKSLLFGPIFWEDIGRQWQYCSIVLSISSKCKLFLKFCSIWSGPKKCWEKNIQKTCHTLQNVLEGMTSSLISSLRGCLWCVMWRLGRISTVIHVIYWSGLKKEMSDLRDVRFQETLQPADSSDSTFIPICIIFFSDSRIGGLEMPLLEALSFDSSHGLTVGCTLRSTNCHLMTVP